MTKTSVCPFVCLCLPACLPAYMLACQGCAVRVNVRVCVTKNQYDT